MALSLTTVSLVLLPGAPASATAPSFVCTDNTVYTVQGTSGFAISKVNALTGASSGNGAFTAGSGDSINALALPSAGRYIYAFNRSTNQVLRFDATTHAVATYATPSNGNASAVVAGAINPATGIYYYAAGGATWTVYAFNTNTNTALGQVATISGTGLAGNGDFAFDASGTLYVVSNSGSTSAGTLARVNQPLPTTAGSAALTITTLTTTPANSGQYNSMAFDSSGALVIGAGSGNLLRVNPTSGATLSTATTTAAFSDMASCALPSTAKALVDLPDGRYEAGDQFTVTITGNGLSSGNTGTTAGTDTGVQDAVGEVAGTVLVASGQTYTITQTPVSGTNAADYTTTWSCVTSTGGAVSQGTGSTGSFTVPAGSGIGVVCTFTNVPRFPAVSLDKTAGSVVDLDGNGHDVGDTITYGFKVTNTGSTSLQPVTVADPKLGAITCPTTALAPGASVTCTPKSYTLTQADLDSGKVDNTATVTGTSPTGAVVTAPDSITTALTPSAAIELDKSASAISDVDGNGQDAGDTITFGFKVTNTGNVTLNPVVVNDPLLGGAAPNVSCPSGALAPGASVTCTSRTYTLTQADVNAGRVDNTATATGTAPGGAKVTDPDSTSTPIPARAEILLAKTAGAVTDVDGNGHDAGDTVTYGFKVTNTGNVTLNPVVVNDPLLSGAAPNVSCPSGALAPGASVTCTSRTYTLTQADVDAGRVDNTATATGTTPGGAKVTDPDTVAVVLTQAAALRIDKTAGSVVDVDGNGQDAGDTITFGFTVTNTGNVTISAITLSDPKLGGPVTCPATSLLPAAAMSCTSITYVLTQADVNAGKVDNTATVSGTGPGGSPVGDADSTSTPLGSSPGIELDKTASAVSDIDSNGVDAGDTITFGFKVTNTGNVTLNPVTLADPLLGGAVTCPAGPVAPAASVTCTQKTYVLTQADLDAGSLSNTATVTGTPPSGPVVRATDSTTNLLPGRPELVLDKSVSAISDVDGNGHDVGDTVTFGFKVTNTGNVTLNPVVVNDPLLSGVAPNVSCPSGALAPGASVTCTSRTYTLTQADVDAGRVDNTATATGTPPSGPVVRSDDSTTTLVAVRADLQLVKTAGAVSDVDGNGQDAGDTITFGFKVTNTGNVTLNPVVVNDPLLGGAAPNVSCPSGALAPGASVTCTSRTYTLTQADVNAGTVDNTATATGTTPGGAQVTDADSTRTTLLLDPALTLDKSASAIVDVDSNGHDAGDTITYGFKVTNTGNVTLNPVVVHDPLLGGASPNVTCPGGPLSPGSSVTCTSRTYTLTQADVNAGTVDNTATATGTTPGGVTVTDDDQRRTPVTGRAAITLDKTSGAIHDLNGNGPDAGDTITYSFVVTNTGTVTLSGVALSDPKIGPVTCPAGSLAPGASVTCSQRTYVITQADVVAGAVVNTATASAVPPTGAPVSDDDTDTTTLPVRPSISLDKTASAIDDLDGNGPDVGDTITYGFVVTNTGNLTLTDVVVSDPMFSSIGCPTGPLAPAATRTCTDQVHVLTAGDIAAGEVLNTATVTAQAPTGATVTDRDSTTTPVATTRADVRITKTVDDAAPRPGETVTYTLTATNAGPGPAADVVIVDTLPAGVTLVGADAPCSTSGSTVTCPVGQLASGGSATVRIRATVDPVAPAGAAEQHLVDVQKTEAQLDVEAGQQRTITVTCSPGYVVTDGSGRIDAVDQGTGTLGSPRVLESRAVGLDTWQVTVLNTATGRAQAKVFAVCVKASTEVVAGHQHPLQVSAEQTVTVPVVAGVATATLTCAPGTTPVQPGFLLDGTATVATSYPSGDDARRFVVTVAGSDTAGSATFSLRCLSDLVGAVDGHQHQLGLAEVHQSVVVPAGEVLEVTLSCADDAKGIVAGWDLESGLVNLGNDPRPKIRVFKLFNPTSGPLGAELWLGCLSTRTTGGASGTHVVNTASVTTTSAESTTADNSASAALDVDTTTPATPISLTGAAVSVAGARVMVPVRCSSGQSCSGRITLVARSTQRLGATTIRKGVVLATATYRVGADRRTTLALKPTAVGRKALRAPGLRTARLQVGATSTVVRIRR
ncbi:hypothetical protein [Nocardioides psychrotolerans]|uniref:DUF7507 domain-containing protein n=1 Tax=Nocardioides psychrotolerans TaxID=1005945 RepID=UPI003137FD9B